MLWCAVAVQFLPDVTAASIPNPWWLTNNPDIANFETGELQLTRLSTRPAQLLLMRLGLQDINGWPRASSWSCSH